MFTAAPRRCRRGAELIDEGRVGVAGDRVGDRRRGVGDAVGDGILQRPTAFEGDESGAEQGVAGADRVGDDDRGSRDERVDSGRSAGDAVAAGRHEGGPGSDVDQRRGRRTRPGLDLGTVEVVDIDNLPAASADGAGPVPSACSASARLGLTRSAPAAAASISRPAVTSTATVPPRSWTNSMSARWALGNGAGRNAATDGDVHAVVRCRGDGVDDVVPRGVAERWTGLVDHGRSAVRLDDNRRAAQLATDRYGCHRQSFGFEHGDSNAAEPAGERTDEAGRRAERDRGPADVDGLAPGRDRHVTGAQHVAGDQDRKPDRAVDRLVETDDEHEPGSPFRRQLDIDVTF